MGLLDQVLGGMLGSQSANSTNGGIGDVLKELLAPAPSSTNGRDNGYSTSQSQSQGGLGGLLDGFTRAGHGDVAESWVGTGQNRPVQPHQLEQVLDRNTLDRLTQKTGLSREELLRQLSDHLPNAVDRLTPQGRRPSPEDMGHW